MVLLSEFEMLSSITSIRLLGSGITIFTLFCWSAAELLMCCIAYVLVSASIWWYTVIELFISENRQMRAQRDEWINELVRLTELDLTFLRLNTMLSSEYDDIDNKLSVTKAMFLFFFLLSSFMCSFWVLSLSFLFSPFCLSRSVPLSFSLCILFSSYLIIALFNSNFSWSFSFCIGCFCLCCSQSHLFITSFQTIHNSGLMSTSPF